MSCRRSPGESPERGWEEAATPDPPAAPPDAEAERRERRQRRAGSSDRPRRAPADAPRHESSRRGADRGEAPKPHARTGGDTRPPATGSSSRCWPCSSARCSTRPACTRHRSTSSPELERDVALALTGGLAGVSGALQLDRPRQLVQSVAGRSDADEIDVAIVIPAATAKPNRSRSRARRPKPAVTKPPGKPKFTPQKKLRLWVAGDSLVITPGYSIVRAAGASPVIESVGGVDGHVATGLTRPDVFNWFEEIRTQVKKLKPHVVVLNFGGNDDKAYMTGLPEGTTIGEFGGPTWQKEYRRRVAGVMDIVNRAGGTVVWIGLPITRSEAQTQRFDIVNAVVQKEAKSAREARRSSSTPTRCSRATRAASPSTWRTRRATP